MTRPSLWIGRQAAWVLGLPHGLAVLHGKIRRGGLVFDMADLIKDAVILPQAFISAARVMTNKPFAMPASRVSRARRRWIS